VVTESGHLFYIDLEMGVSVPQITLDSGIPYALVSKAKTPHGDKEWKRSHFGLSDKVDPPKWWLNEKHNILWIDVRPQLGPIGQLIRELKVLRDYTGPDTIIAVVTEMSDEVSWLMLKNEGFSLIPIETIRKQPAKQLTD